MQSFHSDFLYSQKSLDADSQNGSASGQLFCCFSFEKFYSCEKQLKRKEEKYDYFLLETAIATAAAIRAAAAAAPGLLPVTGISVVLSDAGTVSSETAVSSVSSAASALSGAASSDTAGAVSRTASLSIVKVYRVMPWPIRSMDDVFR